MPSDPAELARWLADTLSECFAEAVETMSGERPSVVVRSATEAPALEDAFWWDQPLSLGAAITVSLGIPKSAWEAIGKHILSSAGVESSDEAEIRGTFLEISNQALAGMARAVGSRVGRTVSCENGAEAPGPQADGTAFELEVTLASGAVSLRFLVSPALLETLAAPEPTASKEVAQSPSAPPMHALTADYSSPSKPGKTLDLLMEVELPVSVSFGRADLALKDVLKLTTGSIIELNRVLTEPVEVIVNNCVVARGEVVVIDGNYGVRIHEIISRDKRLRTLR